MKVYIVMWSNCETYEDYREGISAIYTTREKAVEAIESAGYTHDMPDWFYGTPSNKEWFKVIDEEIGDARSMWIEEWEVKE